MTATPPASILGHDQRVDSPGRDHGRGPDEALRRAARRSTTCRSACAAGAVTGFLGPNGAGKTTALKAIVGIARPTAGRALIDGTPVEAAHPDARSARRLHRADRRPSGPLGAQPPALARGAGRSAGRSCRRGARSWSGSSRRRAAAWGRTPPACASGSGSRRPCSATRDTWCWTSRSTASTPRAFAGCARSCANGRRRGGTVLLSSHVLTEAAQTVDDVVVIHNGRLVFEGAIGELTRLGGSRRAGAHARLPSGSPPPRARPAGGCELKARPGADRGDGRGAGGRARPSRARASCTSSRRTTPRSSRCSLA